MTSKCSREGCGYGCIREVSTAEEYVSKVDTRSPALKDVNTHSSPYQQILNVVWQLYYSSAQ